MQNQQNIISLRVLRTQSDVIGITIPVQLSANMVKPFDASNARGNLRVVESFEKAGDLGAASAKSLMAAIA
ncbi:hypothetical protein [Sulfurovum sp.]|uniref:hypothetical protein n=1 Tax=Sulfurovum sp. TaxID=1969726 RepID=UPI002867FE47|nr:hypothetical protein [Sulfurovum sp.]